MFYPFKIFVKTASTLVGGVTGGTVATGLAFALLGPVGAGIGLGVGVIGGCVGGYKAGEKLVGAVGDDVYIGCPDRHDEISNNDN